MDPALLAAYDRPVPRYTSYPTAAQFTPSVGPVQHAEWLRDLTAASASLYVHVPFCRELCWYCACHTMAMNRPGTLDRYADALLDELEALARVAPGLILEGVQWGGGTPSQLGAARLQIVGKRIARLFERMYRRETSRRNSRPRHEVFRERLTRFQACGRRGRPDNRTPLGAKLVDDSRGKRPFRTHYGEIGIDRFSGS